MITIIFERQCVSNIGILKDDSHIDILPLIFILEESNSTNILNKIQNNFPSIF